MTYFPKTAYRATICAVIVLIALGALAAGCRRGPGAPAQSQGAPPPTAVALVTLAPHPIEKTSDLIATVRSLHATTIQPDVEGAVTRILVKSGDRVAVGTPLVMIDPDKQEATVRTTEASRSGAAADAEYWRQQVGRLQTLVSAGAISKQELDQAQTSLKNAEAKLDALDAQVREGRVQLRYYHIVAPQAGTVGDIQVRQGDRVTKSTIITTIDENASLEAYIQVPIERSPELRMGLPVQILGAEGKVAASNPITFIAPRVDESTQSVLVKSLLKDTPETLRGLQFLRTRIVWSTADGLTVPVVAVSRISGQYFCFVAEKKDGGLVARQRAIAVGDVLGNDYIVRSGLKAGDQVIVSGIQKIADGAPVRPE